jgi:3-oxoacyl-[acyl-carrier-protein] synthase II
MVVCIRQALERRRPEADDIDYINAHATATLQGDQEEAEAIRDTFGASTPVSSLKGYIGHTLGASGAIELAASLKMMEQGLVYPTLNLKTVSPECSGIDHVQQPRKKQLKTILKRLLRRHQRGAGV